MGATNQHPSSTRVALNAAPPLVDPYVGLTFSERYKILSKVGEGSQARVYVGRHVLIDRLVAVKILLPILASHKALVERFLNEGRAAGTLGHPNIVESLDMGFAPDGAPYLVLELLEGRSLAEHIENGGPFAVGRAAYVATQIASALATAHARGIVHRDLKPENVLLLERGGRPDHVKVLDFGISKFQAFDRSSTINDQPLGTPGFMAPEQIENPQSTGPRADVYSLGATLYNLLAGAPPFADASFPKVLRLIVEEEPKKLAELRPGLPPGIVSLVERAMNRNPERRFQSMSELEEALHEFSEEPARVRSLSPGTFDVRSSTPPPAIARQERAAAVVYNSSAPSTYGSLRPASATVASMSTLPILGRRRNPWRAALVALALGASALGGFLVTQAFSRRDGPSTSSAPSELPRGAALPPAPAAAPTSTPNDEAPVQHALPPPDVKKEDAVAQPAPAPEKRAARARPHSGPARIAAPVPKPDPASSAPRQNPKASTETVNCDPPFYYEGKKKIFKSGCI